MKIFYTCDNDLSKQAGDVRHIIEIAENLQKLGHQLIVFAPRFGKYKQASLVKIKYIPALNIRIFKYFVYYLILFFYLIVLAFKQRPNIIYTRQMTTLVPLLVSKILGCPLISEMNNILSLQLKFSNASPFKLFIFRFLDKINLMYCQRVITTSQGLKEQIKDIFKIPLEKISVIGCGADLALFRPQKAEQARKRLNLESNNYYIGFVGSIFPWSGLDYLIRSAPLILKEIPNVEFMIVGEGIARNYLIRLVEDFKLRDHFIFTGELPYEQMPDYINVFDIGVHFFNHKELDPGDPIKIYEYLACRKPVVVSKAFNNLVEENKIGFVVNSNEEEIARAIIRLLKDSQLRIQMGTRGQEMVEERYSWQKAAKKVEEICIEVVKRKIYFQS